jgi:hypothetical protein
LIGTIQLDFQVFADMNRPDPGVAHVFQCVLHGFALRIEHGFFRRDDDFCLHFGFVRGQAPNESARMLRERSEASQPFSPTDAGFAEKY